MMWLAYYKKDFLNEFNKMNHMRNNNADENSLCAQYITLFGAACNLLKLYLNYNGLFQFEPREVIKEAFYTDLIKDGERWMNALALSEVYQSGEWEPFKKLILSYCEDENFFIFNDLNNVFRQIQEEYDNTTEIIL